MNDRYLGIAGACRTMPNYGVCVAERDNLAKDARVDRKDALLGREKSPH
jgi:hypothetical protein